MINPFIETFFSFSILLLILSLSFYPFLNERKFSNSYLRALTFSIATGLAVIVSTTYLIARLNFDIVISIRILIVIMLTSTLVKMYQKKGTLKDLKSIVAILVVISLSSIWQYIPVFLRNSNTDINLGLVTHGNNDVALYSAITQEFISSGFIDSQHFSMFNANGFLKDLGYQTTNALLSFSSILLGNRVWQIMIPAMLLAIAFSMLAIAAMVQSIWRNMSVAKSLAVGIFVNTFAIATYIQSHYFITQVLGLAITALSLEFGIKFVRDSNFSILRSFELAIIICLSVYTYPHFLIPFISIVLIIALGVRYFSYDELRIARIKVLIVGSILGIVISSPYLITSIKLALNIGGALAGWRLDNLNPISLIGNPRAIETGAKIGPSFIIWILFLAISCLLVYFTNRKLSYFLFPLSIMGLLAIITVLPIILRGGDFLAYSSWKLLSYIFPVFVAIVIGSILQAEKKSLLSFILLGAMALSTAPNLWESGFRSTTRDTSDLALDPKIRQQKKLGIDLDPYYESMQMASILEGPELAFYSETYWPSDTVRFSCNLTKIENESYKYTFALNNSYGLSTNTLEGCIDVAETVKTNQIYDKFLLTPFLVSGWSSVEHWGVWSETKTPSLVFKGEDALSNGALLKLTSQAFLGGAHEKLEAVLVLNGERIGSLRFTKDIVSQAGIFHIAASKLNFGSKPNELVFVIDKPVSPKSLGISDDNRQLGIGLISIEFLPMG